MKFWTEKKILWAAMLIYIIFFGIFTSLRHYNFQTQAWDMGIFSQTLWNTTQGRFMTNALEGVKLESIKNHFGVHMSPFLILLAPGYALFPTPYYLLIIQTIALALGALPIYLLSQKIIQKNSWAILIASAYLLYPPLHWANNFDFHEITFFIPLILAGVYFAGVQKWPWAFLFLALAASTKEDAILVVIFFGIYLMLKRKSGRSDSDESSDSKSGAESGNRKMGLAITAMALIYFLISVLWVMPSYGSGVSRFTYRYANLGSNPSEILTNAVWNPALLINTVFTKIKMLYLAKLFLPLLLLPLFSWKAWFLLAPGMLENLLTGYAPQISGFYHYDSILIPGLFIGLIHSIKLFNDRFPDKEKKLWGTLIAAVFLAFLIRSPLGFFYFPADFFKSNPNWETFRMMVNLVPDYASVAAPTNLVPHLINREQIYMLGTEPFPTDIALIDGADLSGFANENVFQDYADSYANSGNYNILEIKNRYFVFSKKSIKLNP